MLFLFYTNIYTFFFLSIIINIIATKIFFWLRYFLTPRRTNAKLRITSPLSTENAPIKYFYEEKREKKPQLFEHHIQLI